MINKTCKIHVTLAHRTYQQRHRHRMNHVGFQQSDDLLRIIYPLLLKKLVILSLKSPPPLLNLSQKTQGPKVQHSSSTWPRIRWRYPWWTSNIDKCTQTTLTKLNSQTQRSHLRSWTIGFLKVGSCTNCCSHLNVGCSSHVDVGCYSQFGVSFCSQFGVVIPSVHILASY